VADLRKGAYAARPHPSGLNVRSVAAGYLTSIAGGRIGRGTKLPPQFGQRPLSRVSTQSRQKVHSNVQIIASAASGGKSLSQHSHPGFSTSMCASVSMFHIPGRAQRDPGPRATHLPLDPGSPSASGDVVLHHLGGERLIEIGDEVGRVFEADR
jgi:hypothetical protein